MRLPIYLGSSDFVEMRSKPAYYVDKTRLIEQVINSRSKVMLLTRPRRFGKTLNLSMLRAFFEWKSAHGPLFEELEISRNPEAMAHFGGYPTVFLSFKDVRSEDWPQCLEQLKRIISQAFLANEETLNQFQPKGFEHEDLQAIFSGTGQTFIYENALSLLTKLLHRATGKKVILLLDEYDTPIHHGHLCGFEREVVAFIRNFLGAALKDNDAHLEKAVITGILRVARDSIFSGLNNLRVYGVLNQPFSDCFGFSEPEVKQLLQDHELCHREDEVKRWYNGYLFGDRIIYNPWSILCMAEQPDSPLTAQWINTSGNDLIRDLVTNCGTITPNDLESLLLGDPFVRQLQTSVVLNELNPESVWSLLVFSGYLTVREPMGADKYDLRIPNLEVRTFFTQTVTTWLGPKVIQGLTPMLQALLAEDLGQFADRLACLVRDSLSYHDSAGPESERIYHVFFLGVMTCLNDRYQVLSNQESGYGRYDLALVPRDLSQPGFVFELKRSGDDNLVPCAEGALKQIQTRAYTAALERQGVQRIHCLGIALSGKRLALASLSPDGSRHRVISEDISF